MSFQDRASRGKDTFPSSCYEQSNLSQLEECGAPHVDIIPAKARGRRNLTLFCEDYCTNLLSKSR